MGTTDVDLVEDPRGGDHGDEGRPDGDEERRRKLYDLEAEEGDRDEGHPRGPFADCHPGGCSRLKYRLLHITITLGPVTKHDTPPTMEDAPGDSEEYREHRERKENAEAILKLLETPAGMDAFCEGIEDHREAVMKLMSLCKEAWSTE